ncbi:hypothetical protein PN419_02620 [Halorubrum ezzemoulense]|uniref:DUF7124 domain-containing protein n=1 Tax=Halorubrum ezzemoulense TaxID=337243 RepID=UPI00233145E1|nr:hypothetical protein [Halorubrum ezzemoulense]MDB9247906.1 hypothetical protein [Halorubrum ezzemoulense]MDB9258185.1 hypothetical protein [Halorubrum ezzemoulense]MDB9261453.1 hypothetical protein [Halorubrum ezzemoulense]MDB9264956.1 hypothetical protein [Halorubrum ezzemoulense]MDB9268546.1 hypothetical protein [Halorubrum ezzemoulense]
MGIDATTTGDGDVTLVFSLGAARSLADPAAAFADARQWSRHVGIVANEADRVAQFAGDYGIDNDYALTKWDKWGTLADIREQSAAPRCVFVGTTRADERVATETGYEFLRVDEAAEKAGWELSDPSATGADGGATDDGRGRGRLGRLRRAVREAISRLR